MRSLDIPLSMTMAVSLLLRDQPSLSMGRKPSKGGSDTLQSLGGGLGGLRPASCGASSMAEGAMVVKWELEMGMRQVQDQGVISCRGSEMWRVCLASAIGAEDARHGDCGVVRLLQCSVVRARLRMLGTLLHMPTVWIAVLHIVLT